MPGLLSRISQRIFSPSIVKAKPVEGEYRDGPWLLPVSGGWLPHSVGQFMNWWQLGYNPVPFATGAMVEACVSAYSQTVAMCPGNHWRALGNGGRERVTNSALSRILRKPNSYQTISDFMLNATRQLYLEGNAVALALRNTRFEITELHLMQTRTSGARVSSETGEVFYSLAGNPIVDGLIRDRGIDPGALSYVPARDVLHIRLHTLDSNPLDGQTPLRAAAADIVASSAMTQQQIAFYTNQARPSFILSTDNNLSGEQTKFLREKWNEQAQGLAQGGTPILTHGLKPHQITTTGRDAEIAEVMKLTDEHIALVYRIPLAMFGKGETPFASTEALMQNWIATGLGFALDHIERAIDAMFALRGVPDEYVEFDTSVLLRSAQKDRVEALAASIKGGIRTINEARAEESLPAVEGGDEIRIQQQDVPLTWHEDQAKAQQAQAEAQAAAAEAEAAKPDDDDDKEAAANDNAKRIFRAAFANVD